MQLDLRHVGDDAEPCGLGGAFAVSLKERPL
jgi:hypothetical protein